MVFIFRQVETVNRPKPTQIETSYSLTSKDFTEDMLNQLRQNAEALAGLRYNHKLVRGNYVSSDKGFKATVYGQNPEEMTGLFERLLPVVNQPF